MYYMVNFNNTNSIIHLKMKKGMSGLLCKSLRLRDTADCVHNEIHFVIPQNSIMVNTRVNSNYEGHAQHNIHGTGAPIHVHVCLCVQQ